MIVVKSKTLIGMSLFMGGFAILSLIGLANSGIGDHLWSFLMGLINDALGAAAAITIFQGKRSAKKWFVWSCVTALATVPLIWFEKPQGPAGVYVAMFVLMAIICGIFWGILSWKSTALDQPPIGVPDA